MRWLTSSLKFVRCMLSVCMLPVCYLLSVSSYKLAVNLHTETKAPREGKVNSIDNVSLHSERKKNEYCSKRERERRETQRMLDC